MILPTVQNNIDLMRASVASLIINCSFQLIHVVVSYLVFKSFGWHVYKRIGADPYLIGPHSVTEVTSAACYQRYQIFLTLIKIDFMFGCILIVTGYLGDCPLPSSHTVGRVWSTVWGFALTAVMLVVTLVWCVLGIVAVAF